MSMRGEIISKEYNRMTVVHDDNHKEYVCYTKDVKDFKDGDALNEQQQRRCLDTSQILGDTW